MTERKPRENEVRSVITADAKKAFAIVARGNGLFSVFEYHLAYDEEEDVEYWLPILGNSDGLYGTPDEAEREIRARHPSLFQA